MSKTQQVVWVVIIIVVLGGLYWWWSSSQNQPASSAQSPFIPATSTSAAGAASSTQSGSTSAAPMSATVMFNGSSFSPASVTIAQGGTVTWVSTAGNMWVASDPHPIHNGYDGTTMQQHCAPGYTGPAPFDECTGSSSNWSFTFDKVGTWGYHDHLEASIMGSVTVVATQ